MAISKQGAADFLRVGEHYLTASSEATDAVAATGSHQAMAIWFYLLNKPFDWVVRRSDVRARFPKISKQAYADAMKALEGVGVVRRVSVIVEGKFAGSRVLVSASFIRDEDIKRGESPSVQFAGRSGITTVRSDGRSRNTTVRVGGHLPSTGVIPRDGGATNSEMIDRPAAKKTSSSQFKHPEWFPDEKWKAYLEARRHKKHPMTAAALQLLIDAVMKTHEAGYALELIIDELVATGWRTAKPEYFENKNHAKNINTSQPRQSVVSRVAAATGLNPDDPSSYDFEQFSDEHDGRDGSPDGGQVVVVDGVTIRE